MLRHLCLLVLAMSGLAIMTAADASPPEGEISEKLDLAYYDGADADPDRHRLNLVLPQTTPPIATLLWAPGGAWAFGAREKEMPIARALARAGVAVAVVDHRMSPGRWASEDAPDTGAVHPQHMEDVARAFAWLHEHADDYGLDREQFFVGGFSAGAHLAALLAMDGRYLAAHGLSPADIAGVVPVGGTYDLEHYYDAIRGAFGQENADGHVLGAFGDREALAGASPSSYVAEATRPMLVIAEGETAIYADAFEAAVKEGGRTDLIRFITYTDETHASLFHNIGDAEAASPARDAMIAFMTDPQNTPEK